MNIQKCRKILLVISMLIFCASFPQSLLAENTQAERAKELFDNVYNLVFGPQGSALNYKVNVIGLYKSEGKIVYKGKKVHYSDKRYAAWEDGVTAYMVDNKKKEVGIYRHDDDDKDNYMSKFKYDINNYDFSYTSKGDYYFITANIRNSSFFGIKWVKAKVYKNNLHPVSLTIKLAMIKATVEISNFRSGGIADSNFVFPKLRFKDYKMIDRRNNKHS